MNITDCKQKSIPHSDTIRVCSYGCVSQKALRKGKQDRQPDATTTPRQRTRGALLQAQIMMRIDVRAPFGRGGSRGRTSNGWHCVNAGHCNRHPGRKIITK